MALKAQRGRITEYFKSQMKPTNGNSNGNGNGLNREIAAWFTKTSAAKSKTNKTKHTNGTKNAREGDDNLEKYIAYLSKTLSPKVLLDHAKVEAMDVDASRVASLTSHKTEPEKIPLPRLNPVINCNKNNNSSSIVKKTDFNKTNSTPQCKTSKEVRVRGPTKQIKKFRLAEAKKAIIPKLNPKAPVRQSVAIPTNLNCIYSNNTRALTDSIEGNVLVNSNPVGVAQIAALPDHLRQLLIKVQASRSTTSPESVNCNNSHGDTNLEQVPSMNRTQMHNSDLNKTPHRTESLVNTPVSVATSMNNSNVPVPMMLAAIRMPEHVTNAHSEASTTTSTNHISITNQSGITNPFVLPLVQNLNGTLLQIPGLVTKVGQNSVMPNITGNGLNHAQSQMFINGTFLKINGHIHGLNKQIGSNSITNVTYAVSPKNLPSAMPTIIQNSKPNYAMNLNQPMFVSSSGFIFNSIGNVVTTQTNTGISHMQQAFTSNVVLTTPVHPGVHIAPHINNTISSLPMSGSIPISPIKLDGMNPVFITPTHPHQPTYSLPDTKKDSIVISNTIANTPTAPSIEVCSTSLISANIISHSEIITDSEMFENNPSNGTEMMDLPSCETYNGTIEDMETEDCKKVCITSENNKDTSMDSVEVETKFNKSDVAFILSEETKFSIDSVSVDINRINDTPSVDSPETEISKELDEDSLNVSITASQEFSISQESPLLSEPKTIRFPAKKHHYNESRNRTVRSNASETKHCQWNDCSQQFDDGSDLLEHLQVRKTTCFTEFSIIHTHYWNMFL